MLCGTQLVMLLCLATLMTVSKSANESRAAKCEEYLSLPACPRDSNPVCGDDGKSYENECLVCAHNFEHETTVRVAGMGYC